MTAKKTDQNVESVKEPSYLSVLYSKIYHNKKVWRLLDDERIQSVLSFGARKRIVADMLEDIQTNSNVLQIGCTFGEQMQKTADKIGRYGAYVIADVLSEQLRRAKQNLKGDKIEFKLYDGRKPFEQKYDTVICFMLLHELPEASKKKVINNALDAVRQGGKVIFADYHRPATWNVWRFILKPFNRLFFPFAEKLWDKPIKNYARQNAHFSWEKKTFGGRMYQKIVAVRQISDEKKPETKPSFY